MLFPAILEQRIKGKSALHLSEALAAVYGTILPGLEGDPSYLAAVGADCLVHLPLTAGSVLTGVTAGLAPLGLILEPTGSIELLLAGRKDEFLAAVFAY